LHGGSIGRAADPVNAIVPHHHGFDSTDENKGMILLFLPDRLVGFPAVNAFMGFAEGAKPAFNLFDKPERGALLFFAGMSAHGAFHADQRHFAIPVRDFIFRGFYGRLSSGPFIFLCGRFSF